MVKVSYNFGQLVEMMYKVCPGLKLVSVADWGKMRNWKGDHFFISVVWLEKRAPQLTVEFLYSGFERTIIKSPLPVSEKGCYVYLNELFDYLSKFSLTEFKAEFGDTPPGNEFLKVFGSRLK